jgi:Ca2+:H+ antiporter
MTKLNYLLLFVPLALLAEAFGWRPEATFALAFLAIIPLAALLSEATEVLAHFTGPKLGGLINATFGNATELILLITLLRADQFAVVKASIAGAILTALLLAVGLSQLLGGARHGVQHFNREDAGMSTNMMTLAVIGLVLPTILGMVHDAELPAGGGAGERAFPALDELSLVIAGVLMLLYVLYLVFQFRQATAPDAAATQLAHGGAAFAGAANGGAGQAAAPPTDPEPFELGIVELPRWSRRKAVILLLAASVGIAVVGEALSGSIEPVGAALGLGALFMGVIILPLVGMLPEILVGVRAARADRMDLTLATLTGSATQIALFVAPLLVFLSLFSGHELTLAFNVFEVVALALAVLVVILIAEDGKSNWLEGTQLLALYAILAAWFFFLPPGMP